MPVFVLLKTAILLLDERIYEKIKLSFVETHAVGYLHVTPVFEGGAIHCCYLVTSGTRRNEGEKS